MSFRQCRGPDSENCLEVLQLLFIKGRRQNRFYAEADPHGPVVQITIEIPQLVDTVVDFVVVRGVQILRCRCGEDIRAPTVVSR